MNTVILPFLHSLSTAPRLAPAPWGTFTLHHAHPAPPGGETALAALPHLQHLCGIPIARDGCKRPDPFGSTRAKSSDSPRRTLCPPGLMQRCPCETRCTAGTAMKARAQAGRATPALPASTRPGTWTESVSVDAQGGMGGYW